LHDPRCYRALAAFLLTFGHDYDDLALAIPGPQECFVDGGQIAVGRQQRAG
jgi:hypothetical protein